MVAIHGTSVCRALEVDWLDYSLALSVFLLLLDTVTVIISKRAALLQFVAN